MLRAIIITFLAAFVWAALVILIGYELPFGCLIVALAAARFTPKHSRALSVFTGCILCFLGIICAHFLSFSFFTAPTLGGIFSSLNLDFFFNINHYFANFWTVYDFIWMLLAVALTGAILFWRTR